MGLFSRRSQAPLDDCLECTIIGSGAMFALSGYMLWGTRALAASTDKTQIRFLRGLSGTFAALG
ncbi:MAG: hypothetical protein SGPRY_013089, partial [Prymnesium sp.]